MHKVGISWVISIVVERFRSGIFSQCQDIVVYHVYNNILSPVQWLHHFHSYSTCVGFK